MPEEPIVTEETTLLRLLADIVAAYVGHSPTPVAALPEMIRSVYVALRDVGTTEQADGSIEPAVPIKKSVFPDYIICLEDGKKLKMLKRHLRASYDMTRRVSQQMGLTIHLSDGGAQLCSAAVKPCQGARPGPKADRGAGR